MKIRERLCFLIIAVTVITATAFSQDTQYPAKEGMIPGPATPADSKAWLTDLRRWREESHVRLGYSATQYERQDLKWTQSSFMQPQMMIHERYFYDPAAGKYTVDRYLDDLETRFGGIDSVLVWQSYPNIGVDDRNQYDMIRDMPGGIPALQHMIADFHKRGVHVFFPVMVWDGGTHDEGVPDWTASTRLMAEIGADGLNGDTLFNFPHQFRVAADATGHALALEPQLTPEKPDEQLAWNNMSWNDWVILSERGGWQYPFVPEVTADKWLETRHLVNVCDRWSKDRTDDLQHAFFNGTGFESWENIWGIWNVIDDRDAEALRRISSIERTFPDLLVSPDWEPYTPTLQHGIFASKFPGSNGTLWTFINRTRFDMNDAQIEVPFAQGTHYYDLWHGVELHPVVKDNSATLNFEIEARGYGAVFAATKALDQKETNLINKLHGLSVKPLASYSPDWHFLSQHIVEIAPVKAASAPPDGMVKIPAGKYLFQVNGIEVEGGDDVGVDVQMPWENSPRREHFHAMDMKSFYIDKYPVTNEQFKRFMDATHYQPKDAHNFLRDWHSGNYPEGGAQRPVTWVSLEDARAYATWAGKRLPHEWEWQYAAQGADGRLYPWGNDWNSAAVPKTDHGRRQAPAPDVGKHPAGASVFGVMDLVGNVWQWTDEYQDDHTRAGILRGGSYYQPGGSRWYFPQAYKLNEHGKYLLMAPSIDRSASIGFRCVVDAE
jgi:formylglycine-generating enzyme required for sulfatase activity/nicotinamidase-related amidase